MKWGKEIKTTEEVHTVLGIGSRFEGKLFFEGIVRIDGFFSGEIFTKGKLVIGEKAEVKGVLDVEDAEIAGIVEGNIVATGKVHLKGTAKLIGDIHTPVLIIEEGAIFTGNCKMEKRKRGELTEEKEFFHFS